MEISKYYTSGAPKSQSINYLGQYLWFYLELPYFQKWFLLTTRLPYALPGYTLSYDLIALALSLLQAHVTGAHMFFSFHSYIIPNFL